MSLLHNLDNIDKHPSVGWTNRNGELLNGSLAQARSTGDRKYLLEEENSKNSFNTVPIRSVTAGVATGTIPASVRATSDLYVVANSKSKSRTSSIAKNRHLSESISHNSQRSTTAEPDYRSVNFPNVSTASQYGHEGIPSVDPGTQSGHPWVNCSSRFGISTDGGKSILNVNRDINKSTALNWNEFEREPYAQRELTKSVMSETYYCDNRPKPRNLTPNSVRGRLLRQKNSGNMGRMHSKATNRQATTNSTNSFDVSPTIDKPLSYSTPVRVLEVHPSARDGVDTFKGIADTSQQNTTKILSDYATSDHSSLSQISLGCGSEVKQLHLDNVDHLIGPNRVPSPTLVSPFCQVSDDVGCSATHMKRDSHGKSLGAANYSQKSPLLQNDSQDHDSGLKNDKFISLNCPSCNSMQQVLPSVGATHQCSNCRNFFKVAISEIHDSGHKPTSNKVHRNTNSTSSGKKRPLHSKQRVRSKRVPDKPECVTIVSSDDDEDNNTSIKSEVALENVVSGECENITQPPDEGICPDKASCTSTNLPEKLSHKMKLKGGKIPEECVSTLSKGKDNADSLESSPLVVAVDFVQFGAIPGKAIAPLQISSAGLFLKVGIMQENKTNPKETFEFISAGSYSVQIKQEYMKTLKVYVGREPSMLIIIPTNNFYRQVNENFRQVILNPESKEFIQHQIIITLAENPSSETEANDLISKIKSRLPSTEGVQLICHKEAEHYLMKVQEHAVSYKVYNSKVSPSLQKTPQKQELPGKDKVQTMLVYPKPAAHGSVTVTTEDIQCLDDGTYLNDVIIDFYLRYLLESKLDTSDKERTHLFSSFFYSRLTQKIPRYQLTEQVSKMSLPERMHNLVKKWTRNIDIFDKDFILIPVNEHSHWYLVVICFPCLVPDAENNDTQLNQMCNNPGTDPEESASNDGTVPMEVDESIVDPVFSNDGKASLSLNTCNSPDVLETKLESRPLSAVLSPKFPVLGKELWNPMPCILIFDSLGVRTSNRVFTNLRNYLTYEWKVKRPKEKLKVFDKDTMKGSFPKVPLQNNDCDCGIYVLQYAEAFFTNPILSFKPPVKKESWFKKETVDGKREEIRSLIFKLREESSNT